MSDFDSVKVFYSYAEEDEELRGILEKHLTILRRKKIISVWHYHKILAGSDWQKEINLHLEEADIILLLISADYIASDYCYYSEMKRAMEMHESGKAYVIPILLREVDDWRDGTPFGKLQALPSQNGPVMSWPDKDAAFANVARGIRERVTAHLEQKRSVSLQSCDHGNTTSPSESGRNRQTLIARLRAGSKTYHDRLRNPGGRYSHLSIEELILPGTKFQMIDTSVQIGKDQVSLKDSLEYLWPQDNKHAVLLGEGGMGKTVSLLRLWKQYLDAEDEQSPVPIFLALNEYNNVGDPNDPMVDPVEVKKFIITKIGREYLSKENLSIEEVNDIWNLLSTPLQTGKKYIPSIILLLDGFNEVTVTNRYLLLEINELRSRAVGVQFVVTSRYDMCQTNNWNDFAHLDLLGLTDDQIANYLEKNYPEDRKKSKQLLELLKNPMMLTIYASTCSRINEYRGHSNLFDFKWVCETKGELLWNFVESLLVKEYESFGGINSEYVYRKLIVKHLLPYIGYHMEKMGKYDLTEDQLETVVLEGCKRFTEQNFLNTFREFRKYTVAFDFTNLVAVTSEYLTKYERIQNTLLNNSALLIQNEKGSFGFFHQHFRDFFAAVHVLNEIKIALKLKSGQLPLELGRRALPLYVRRFVGEIEQEHYNLPTLEEGVWLIQHYKETRLTDLLERCRGKFDDVTGLVVWNIIEIWKDVRKELTGADLTALNLTKVGLNNVRCSRWYGENYVKSIFDKCLLNEKTLFSQGHSGVVNSVIYSNDGKKILSSSGDGTVKEWEVEIGECLRTYKGHSGVVKSAIYSNDGKKILSSSDDRTVKEWEVETGECLKTYEGHEDWVKSAIYSNDGKKILSSSDDGTVKEWEVEIGECLRTYEGHSGWVNSAIYSNDGKKILSSSYDRTVKEWEVETGECLKTYEGHSGWVNSAVYSNDGKKILSSSSDRTVKEWEVETGEWLITYEGHSGVVNSAIYSNDGKKILSSSDDRTVREWEVETGECLRTYEGHSGVVTSAIYSNDGKKIFSSSYDRTVKEWDVETGECLRTYEGWYSGGVTSAIYSNDGKKILSSSSDRTVKEWEVETGEWLRTYEGHSGVVNSAVYSNDGKKILSSSSDRTVKEWEVETGEWLRTYEGHSMAVTSAIYNNDGKKILSSSGDGTVKKWDVETGECLRTYLGHSAIYSNDGKKILSRSDDRTVKELDEETGEWRTYEGHSGGVTSAIYSNDKKKVLSISDRTINEWNRETNKPIQALTNIPGLLIQGCSFKNLHPDSKLSESAKKILRTYKAILD